MFPVFCRRDFAPGTSVSVAAATRLDDDDRPGRVAVAEAAVSRKEVALGKVSGLKIPDGNDFGSGAKVTHRCRSSEVAEIKVIGQKTVVLVHLDRGKNKW